MTPNFLAHTPYLARLLIGLLLIAAGLGWMALDVRRARAGAGSEGGGDARRGRPMRLDAANDDHDAIDVQDYRFVQDYAQLLALDAGDDAPRGDRAFQFQPLPLTNHVDGGAAPPVSPGTALQTS